MSKWMKTILYVIGSAFLTHLLPFSSFFRNVDTMVHETGHALITLLLSGHVMDIQLYEDHSGVTHSLVGSSMAMIPVGLAGYMTASLFAWLMFSWYAKGLVRTGLMVITMIAVADLLLFVRNGFGVVWLIGFIAVNAFATLWGGTWLGRFYYLLLAFLCLEESVFGPLSLIVYALNNPRSAGDATVLSSATPVPAIAWSIWFTLFGLWCAKMGIDAFTGRRKGRGKGSGRPPQPQLYPY